MSHLPPKMFMKLNFFNDVLGDYISFFFYNVKNLLIPNWTKIIDIYSNRLVDICCIPGYSANE